jgi:4-aminobutyrate aminotransferase
VSGEIPLSEGDVNLSEHRRTWRTEQIGPETAALLDEDARYFLHQSLSTPCLNALSGASGATLTDMEGRACLDFHGNSVHQVGYGHPKVLEAVKRQLDELPFCPRRYTNGPAVELAKRLAELTPGNLSRCLFAPGGAEAMSMALKLARAATGRYKTVSFWDSFHGATLDTIALGGEAIFRRGMEPLASGALHIPPPDPARCLFGCGGTCALRCAEYLDYVLEKEGDVGAVVAEPIRCTTVHLPPPGYWQTVREICDRHGALLIFDEIPVCLGRTGTLFACEQFGVTPDMLILGKGLGGGVFPMAALIARGDLNVAASGALGHFTHEKSPVGAAAALATLDIIAEEGLCERANRLGETMVARLQVVQERFPARIAEVRGIGLLIGVQIGGRDRADAEDAADAILYACLRRGLSFKVSGGNVLTLTPPLTIAEAELGQAMDILEASIAEAESERPNGGTV